MEIKFTAYGKKFRGKNWAIFQVYLIWFVAFKMSTRKFVFFRLHYGAGIKESLVRGEMVSWLHFIGQIVVVVAATAAAIKTINVTNVRSMCLNIIYYWVGIFFVQATIFITQTKRHKAQQHLIFYSVQSWWLIYDLFV